MPHTSSSIIIRETPANRFTVPVLMALLEQAGIDRLIPVRAVTSRNTLFRTCGSLKSAVVLYSFMTPHWPDAWHEVRQLRKKFKNRIFLIAGGPHPSGAPEQTLRMGFDLVICGAGESVLADTVMDILDDPKSHRNRILRNNAIAGLDGILPVSVNHPFIPPLEIMRGCHYRCAFCQTGHTHQPVYRSLDSVQAYLDSLIRRKRLFRNGFICPSGLEYGAAVKGKPDLEKIWALLSLCKSGGITHLEYGIFPSEIYPRSLSEEALRILRQFCSNKKLTFGAQSGSASVLKRIRRGHTKHQIESAVSMARAFGFRPILDFIIGFPGESEQDRIETLEWIRVLHTAYQARIQMHYFIPLAGTAMAGEKPSLPGERSRALLDAYHKGGICTNWWQTGFRQSWAVIHAEKVLSENGGLSGV
ncbi:TIGR04013 family B12-binding domain/radical SAM domain-containing protein [bacterium]|nr:TIGR04013 family B12-binding domain/radical SAM domain-containing protein [bacterium]